MPLVLFLLWVVFNGRIAVDVMVSGVVITLLISLFCYRHMGYRIKNDLNVIKRLGKLIRYFFLVLVNMFLSVIQIIGFVLSSKKKIKPTIIHFQPDIKSIPGRVMLANTITLIPGSVTGELTDNGYSVHAFTPEIADAQRGSIFEQLIKEMENDI